MRPDKGLHGLCGLLIAAFVGVLTVPIYGLLAGILAGAAKEWVWDMRLKRGVFEWWDFGAAVIGSLAAYVLM